MKRVIALGLATALSVSMNANHNLNNSKTFLRFETPYQSASPERVSLFNTEDIREKHRSSHNGNVQFTVFGGQNSKRSDAAAYYMPGGLATLQFNASIDANNSGRDRLVTYWSGAQDGVTRAQIGSATIGTNAFRAMGVSTDVSGAGTPLTLGSGTGAAGTLDVGTGAGTANAILNTTGDPAPTTTANTFVVETGTSGVYNTYDFDEIRAFVSSDGLVGDFRLDTNKNIGIMRPWNFGVGYAPNVQMDSPISESAFVSAITPELKRSHWGIGANWKQLLSDEDTGFFIEISTALQRVTMDLNLNEVVAEALTLDPSTNTNTDWSDTWSDQGYSTGNTTAPTTITEAFAQDAWNYGKVNGAQSITRLADIELKLGYQFICEDNVMSNGFLGLVIPTGNKAQSVYLAEPIVGNGFHFGIMGGSTSEIQLDSGTDTRWSARSDASFRYLFQNTQKRSFDTVSNGQWSRYMMVWPDYATEQANGEIGTTINSIRDYTPGINVFTQDVKVTPRAQARLNQALVLESGSFKGELGFNMMVRQAEKVELVTAWADNTVAFVDASNDSTSLYNSTRTIYNDSYQSTPISATAGTSEAFYNAASISASDLNLGSAASRATYTNTPYLTLGYAFNEEKSSVASIGGSYEMSATNGYINNWTLWGKFGFSF